MRLLKYILIVTVILLSSSALAHMGYDLQCCSDQHCHPVSCEELIEQGKNVIYHGMTFSGDMIKSTKDNLCHVCTMPSWSGERPLCVYIQFST